MVFDNDGAAMLGEERFWQTGGNEPARLLLGGRPLQEHARRAYQKPLIARSDFEVRRMILLVCTIHKPTVWADRLRPDQRPSIGTWLIDELILMPVPNERTGAHFVAPIGEPVAHPSEPFDERYVTWIARQEPGLCGIRW